MNPIARNILVAIVAFVGGSVVNMGLIKLGPFVIPLPEGVDLSTEEGFREGIKLFTPANFVFPFLAHALGTLSGAFIAAKLSANHKMRFAIGIGVAFLLGGTTMVFLFGGPAWFIACDLLLAYIPMGWLGGMLAGANRPEAE